MRFLLAFLRERLEQTRQARAIRSRFPTLMLEPQVVVKGELDNLSLSGEVVVQSGAVLHLGGQDWCLRTGHLEIGAGSCISPNCVLYTCGPGGIRIGERFDCGPGVGIFASRTDYERGPRHHIFLPVRIGSDVIVFANAVISPGVTIGDGAVILAGSVVNDSVPAGALVGGSPAKMLRWVKAHGPDETNEQP